MLSVEAAASFPVLAVVLLSLELPHPATMDANIDAHNKVLITFFFIKLVPFLFSSHAQKNGGNSFFPPVLVSYTQGLLSAH